MIDRAIPPFGFAGLAGHIDPGETESQALKREVEEESGLKIEKCKPLFAEMVSWNWCSKGIKGHFWHLFECEVSGEMETNPREVKAIGWYTPQEIKKLKLEPVWEYWFKKLGVI